MRSVCLPLFVWLALQLAAQPADTTFLAQLMRQQGDDFHELLSHPEKYELQIIYTQIDQRGTQKVFTPYHFRVDPHRYFYPASTVKMPAAFLALEKLNQLHISDLTKHSAMIHGMGHPPQTAARQDTTSPDGLPSIAQYIRKIFLVSDNEAYNRLYEFLGQEYINQQLIKKGYANSRIIHRLGAQGAPFGPEENQSTNPVSFYNGDGLVYHQGEVNSQAPQQLELRGEQKGKGFFRNGKLVEQPFDFQHKNFVALNDLNEMLKSVLFPESVPSEQRFQLTEEDYQFLYRCMGMRPRESKSPTYDKADSYVKFFLFGAQEEDMPEHIRIYNKVGWAYGYLTDVAYIVDSKNDVEFMLAASIHVNDNQIFNDNNYQYETIGMPFFARLGEAIYQHELQRSKNEQTDLSRFEFFGSAH
ncbi:MAG: serine hydrolase [Bacteroidota bacterium]